MKIHPSVSKRNFRLHLLEGAFYIGTGALLSSQTFYPALVKALGGTNATVGALPVVAYLAFFLPQIFAANYTTRYSFRKKLVLGGGLLQRLQILVQAIDLILLGTGHPIAALVILLFVVALNQILAGITSPAWFDFVSKTVDPSVRGKLMGLRASSGAAVGFFNALLLAYLLGSLQFPANFAAVFVVAFVFQLVSLLIQRRVVEEYPSIVQEPAPLIGLFKDATAFLKGNRTFTRFLIASSFLTVGFTPMGFFMVSAMKKFNLPQSSVGIFTLVSVVSQIVLGGILGWLADRQGNKTALLLSAGCFAFATFLVVFSPSVLMYYVAFLLVGGNLGTEVMLRYNFAADCASEDKRPLAIGLMNAWFAPLYLSSIVAGWWSDKHGYESVFIFALVCSAIGIVLLSRVPDPRPAALAVSSK